MVFLMTVFVMPLGVLAAVYLHEYAGDGYLTRLIRTGVHNLAAIPSVIYGVFGLGLFVYGVGGELDRLFFNDALPAATFGEPGLLWASLTLALLTLPVVIVATEEGMSRIPRSIVEASYALGATRAETLIRLVLPLTAPAMMTGLILAIARAAGEVAPLMLVGVVEYAPTLPLKSEFPFLALDQKFMHLGHQIYDLGFQSLDSSLVQARVYATAVVLFAIVVALNALAVALRNRLNRRYQNLLR
jgi:phosphate transport system permease protein